VGRAARHDDRDDEGDGQRDDEEAAQVAQSRVDVGQRHGEARGATRAVGKGEGHGGVHEALVHRRAPARRRARAAREGLGDLGASDVVLEVREAGERDLGVAEHAPVGRDERHAPARARPEAVGQRVPRRRAHVGHGRRRVLDEGEADEQVGADAVGEVGLDGGPQVRVGGDHGHDDQAQRDGEQLRADVQLHGRRRLPQVPSGVASSGEPPVNR
jgi:hypothetical protein